MNYSTARLYALSGVPVGRLSTAEEFDLGPSTWISFERGRWRINSAGDSSPLRATDLAADDYMATDWITPANWSNLPAISPQADFPDNPYYRTSPTFDVLDPRP